MQRCHSLSINPSRDSEHFMDMGSFSATPNSTSPPRLNGSTIQRSISVAAVDILPKYIAETDPRDDKKNTKFRPEQTVHLIPVVLLICFLVLWLGSAGDSQMGIGSSTTGTKSQTAPPSSTETLRSTVTVEKRSRDSFEAVELQQINDRELKLRILDSTGKKQYVS